MKDAARSRGMGASSFETTDYTDRLCSSVDDLLGKCVAAEEILSQIRDGVVKGFARVARTEIEFARRFRTVEVPEILRHLDRARLDRRTHVPLLEKRIEQLRARDRHAGR